MKRPAQLIEVATSITENVRETPEESLRFISINNSEERITHKQTIKPAFEHLKLTKKDSFLINGWNQPNTGQSRTDRPTKRDKSHTYFGTNTITTIDTHSHKERHRSLQTKKDDYFHETNFNFRPTAKPKHRTKTSLVKYSPQPNQDSYNDQRLNLIKFYQNQRQKRLLMNESLVVASEIGFIQYPIMGVNIRSKRGCNTKKAELYRRYHC